MAEQPIRFDRLEGLPHEERRPFNLIVSGRGFTLLKGAETTSDCGPADVDTAPRSVLEQRYCAGATILNALSLGVAHPSHASPEDKPSVILLPSATAQSATLLFSGNNAEFALPAHLLLGHDTHLILIRDRKRCFALAGIPGLGQDYAACVESLQRVIAALGTVDLYVLGISAGGAAAMKFACDLAAKRLLCFSTPTTLDLADDPGAELKHYPQLAQLYRADRSLGIDLAAYYKNHPTHPPAVFVYNEGHIRDAWLASRMADVEGVELVPTSGYKGHTTYRWLIVQKTINTFLDMLYPAAPVAQPAVQPALQQLPFRAPDDGQAAEPGTYDATLRSRMRGWLDRLGRRRVRQGYASD